MLKKFKQATLKSLKTTGVTSLVHNSRWRRERLLILAYHGISTHDEHLWDDSMFMPAAVFARRLELIKRSGCQVLPLAEAVTRLYTNTLPDRSVAITFDDGTQDFYRTAFPLLREYNFPVTVYLSTFYADFNRPVFDVMAAYLLWRGRAGLLSLRHLMGRDETIELRSGSAREHALNLIRDFTTAQNLSAAEKDSLLAQTAEDLQVDYRELVARRAIHLLNQDEIKSLADQGVDFQLHTHRHRTPMNRELFLREVDENRQRIQQITGLDATHFCYPSGVYDTAFLPWLREAGVTSATTCDFGLASRSYDSLLLPRLVDVSSLSEIEFEGWLSGISAVLPRRPEAQERVA